ncbi:MAG: hypothetical protein IKE39_09980 [Cutibacterium sp.]|nr:hypothetical protein [Cutibacterium sp.]
MPGIRGLLRKAIPLRASVFGDAKDEFNGKMDRLENNVLELSNRLDGLEQILGEIYGSTQEIIYAESLRSSTNGCKWLEGASFSPGRWAVGYQYLYVLFHVLNDTRPKSILDLGLGQTTNMIARYASSFDGIQHDTIEHDENRIHFFEAECGVSDRTNVIQLPLAMERCNDCASPVRAYDGFGEALRGKQYDLISIDAPFGYDMEELSRIDVLKMLPGILSDSFVIMLDDYNRVGEQHTTERMKSVLDEHGIDYVAGVYRGSKSMLVICSPDKSFITSL